MLNEDIPTNAYKYSWSSQSDLPLKDFLTKFKPSLVQNDGTKPWIFVHGTGQSNDVGVDEATEEATELCTYLVLAPSLGSSRSANLFSSTVKQVTAKVEEIKTDDSIPVRSNKKTGAKSKKEVREKVQEEATEKLKAIAQKHGSVSGKWLIFAPADKIDLVWSSIATSLVSGPLQATTAFQAKVATSPENDNPNYQHLICVYIPDVYDKDSVTEVMKVLLRNHGVNLSGVKSNLYTHIGIDSKHPSGIPSTIWKNSAILSEAEIKELKDAFFADLSTKKDSNNQDGDAPAPDTGGTAAATEPLRKPKTKPKLKKKGNADPFGSDADDDQKDDGTKKPVALKKPSKRMQDVSTDDDDEEDRPQKKRMTKK